MNTFKKYQRTIATFFLLIFFPTIFPTNLFASTNGPAAPEAASFEPVDATDMVNLVTGQYSYVLPLLNVPSPEGGYPLALSYHAGIALDQDASWTGLGWNVNPGAINRNVNGYPDDYNSSHLNEYFYDSGGSEYASFISAGWSCGAASVGLGFNWGSNQSLGGFVSVGVGLDVGTASVGVSVTAGSSGSSIGVGLQTAGGLSVGVSASSDGEVGVTAGYNSNGSGFTVGYNTSGTYSFSANATTATGFSISSSSSGSHVEATLGGVGMGTSFNNTISMGDYSTNSSSWMVPIVVPTPVGIFSLSFGKQTFKYWLSTNKNNFVTGPLNFYKGVNNVVREVWTPPYDPGDDPANTGPSVPGYWSPVLVGYSFMDIYEVSASNNIFLGSSNLIENNMTFPGFDSFNVQAQGLSGSMSANIFENGALFGLSNNENNQGYKLKYNIDGSSTVPDHANFETKPNFYFANEITSYIDVSSAQFNLNSANSNILQHYSNGVELNAKPRAKTSTFIEYYTNDEIKNNYLSLKDKGYLKENIAGINREGLPKEGIGAFKITSVDGKTYHYSLPVYNHEIITRTFGTIEDRPNESQSYFEKRQLEPYATHWLLTAVTGPDYVDNGDGVAGTGDLGYWTSFEYGKWTDACIWKGPSKDDFFKDETNPNIKTWVRGRKQVYYLDKVKTRTHTAVFVKKTRTDASTQNWVYNSVNHTNYSSGDYVHRFTVPQQNPLALDKIILLKNEDDTLNKAYGPDLQQSVTVGYPNSDKISEVAKYNIKDGVIDMGDNWQEVLPKALKVIDFGYDYSLVNGDNRLTLKAVNFKGKGGSSVLPPYKFEYNNNSSPLDINKMDDGWGYMVEQPEAYSLSRIVTPDGGSINVEYEGNKCKSLMPHSLVFSNLNLSKFKSTMPTYANVNDMSNKTVIIDVGSANVFSIPIGQVVSIELLRDYVCFNDLFYYYRYSGAGHVTENLGGGKYKVLFDQDVYLTHDHHGPHSTSGTNPCNMDHVNGNIAIYGPAYYHQIKVTMNLPSTHVFSSGGPRVSKIKISDFGKQYITEYKYGLGGDGIGYVSYIPYTQNTSKEVPYSAELPAPRVMYDYVSVTSKDQYNQSIGGNLYKFNIMKDKSPNSVKYGDFYEITKTVNNFTNTVADKTVSVGDFVVKDNLAAIGQLLEVTTFNSKGHKLSTFSNNYYGMTQIPNNIGVQKESYQTYKTIDYTDNTNTKDKWVVNSTTRIKYPNILKSSTEQKDGYTFVTEFNDYDLISGISKEQIHTSSEGRIFKSRIVPAYIKYPDMGSKVDNIDNINMLSQTTANYSYIFDNGVWKETGVGITTWSNQWNYQDIGGDTSTPINSKEKIWRKHKTYVWNGVVDNNGIFQNYNSATDDSFNWTVGVGSQPSQWKQISEVTRYNHFSKMLEAKDINNNYMSTKMGPDDSKVMVSGNARYNEMYYAGAENIMHGYWLEPEVRMQNGIRTDEKSHTGKYSVKTTSDSQLGIFMRNGHRASKYKLSVWAHKDNVDKARVRWFNNDAGNTFQFNGEKYYAGDWVLLTHYIDRHFMVNTNAFFYVNSIDSTPVYFDDLMLRPIASSMTGYVYNEFDELTYIVGNNGLATKFEYDAAGRLTKTYIEVVDDPDNGLVGGFKKKTENKIHYKNL
ncbi:hypothetical protein [Flavobacterium pedocola]